HHAGAANRPRLPPLKGRKRPLLGARAILVENNGWLLAGWSLRAEPGIGKPRPIGTNSGSELTIRLYGSPDDPPISCKSGPTCGGRGGDLKSDARPTNPPA